MVDIYATTFEQAIKMKGEEYTANKIRSEVLKSSVVTTEEAYAEKLVEGLK